MRMRPQQQKEKQKPPAPDALKEEATVKVKQFQTLRGMKDVFGEDVGRWSWIESEARRSAEDYGFALVETPILEESALFVKTIGRGTDIIEQEMFSFETLGGEKVSLRPENTAGVARAYIQHGMWNLPQPVKLWYWGPFFRYDRPQAGRFRQFHQLGFEVIGDGSPLVDAFLMIQAMELLQTFGLDAEIQLNSIGCSQCRPLYIEQLTAYYREHRMSICAECKKRLGKNVLRVLDCKEHACQPVKREAPQSVDALCEACKDHFMRLLEYLDERDVVYTLEPSLVRGLDYYTKTVFEIVQRHQEQGGPSAGSLAGGGRYDGLIEFLGGRSTPAFGVAFGLERLVSLMRATAVAVPPAGHRRVFVAQLGDAARRSALKLYGKLRSERIPVAHSFSKDGLKAQLEIANSLKVPYVLIIGQKEVLDHTVLVRDMEGGVQEIVEESQIISEIQRRLKELNGTLSVLPNTETQNTKDTNNPKIPVPEIEEETVG